MKNKIVREVIEFVKGHQLLFDQIVQLDVFSADELTMEQLNLVCSILCKVLPAVNVNCNSILLISVLLFHCQNMHATFQMFVIIKLSRHLEAWVLDMILNITL